MTYRVAGALFVLMALGASAAFAGDCRRTGSVCVDATPCKTISGQQVCLSQLGLSCWEYEDTYTCLKPNAVNYCQPFINAQPQCWQTNSQCAQMDTMFNTGCMRYTQTWRCGNPSFPTPPNTIRLDDTYTLVSGDYDTSQCQSLRGNPNCQIAESRCIQTTPDEPLPPGIDPAQVAPDGCYRRQETYACFTGNTDNSECNEYASNPNCTLQSATPCAPEDQINGRCTFEQQTYQCMSRPPQTSVVTDCSGQFFCHDGKCFDTSYPNDPDFARSMALMEAVRQAGGYMDPNSFEIFKGVDSRCKIKVFGLVNCCKKKSGGGGMSNSHLALRTGLQAARFFGSPYVYDALLALDAPEFIKRGASFLGITGGPSLTSFYGFQFSFSTTAGLQYLGFDPVSFALQIGFLLLRELLSCEQNEQILALRRGQNLCYEVGTYCSRRLPIVRTCIERTRSYCCYNSRLARIINEQGRPQIGKGWGTPQSPNCSGFTKEEFERLDFSRIDLSEFTAEIMANIKMPNVGSLSQQVQSTVQQKVLNYYQR